MSEQEKTAEMPLGHKYEAGRVKFADSVDGASRDGCNFWFGYDTEEGDCWCGQPESAHLPAPSDCHCTDADPHACLAPRPDPPPCGCDCHAPYAKPPVTLIEDHEFVSSLNGGMLCAHVIAWPRLCGRPAGQHRKASTWVPASRTKPMCAPDEWESEFYEQGDVATRVRRPASPETPPSDGGLDSNGASAEDHLEAISNCCAPCLGCLTAIQAYGDARAQQAAKEERERIVRIATREAQRIGAEPPLSATTGRASTAQLAAEGALYNLVRKVELESGE